MATVPAVPNATTRPPEMWTDDDDCGPQLEGCRTGMRILVVAAVLTTAVLAWLLWHLVACLGAAIGM